MLYKHYTSACLPACLPACLLAFLPACLSVRLTAYLSVCLPACCLPACLTSRCPLGSDEDLRHSIAPINDYKWPLSRAECESSNIRYTTVNTPCCNRYTTVNTPLLYNRYTLYYSFSIFNISKREWAEQLKFWSKKNGRSHQQSDLFM